MACPSSRFFWSRAVDFSCSARRRPASAAWRSSDSLAARAAASRSASSSCAYRCRILSSISVTALSYSSVASGLLHRGHRVPAGSAGGGAPMAAGVGAVIYGMRGRGRDGG